MLSPILLNGYTHGEIFASYQREHWRLRINVKNAPLAPRPRSFYQLRSFWTDRACRLLTINSC